MRETEAEADDLSRRGFLRAAVGGAGVAATSGAVAAQSTGTATDTPTGTPSGTDTGTATAPGTATESGGGGGEAPPPEFGGHFQGVSNFDGVVDRRGQAEVTVEVGVEANTGAFGFGPAAVHVDNGTTVRFEWTGNGGSHNVVNPAGEFGSELFSQAGVHFERGFDTDGIYNYVCEPHTNLGMKGAIVVGSDYETAETGGGGRTPRDVPSSAKTLGVATGFVMVATLGLAYFFMKYGGDYDDWDT